jgi:predicted DCC family thiol-disulfide oxidoreductase YuxK
LASHESAESGRHLILYDAVCGLCDRTVRFILPRDHRGLFHFAALQSDIGRSTLRRFGRDPDHLNTFCVETNYRSASPDLLDQARAALFVAKSIGGGWRAFTIFGILPDALLNPAYGLVARHRYQVFGQQESCLLPSPEYRSRFVDR